MAYDIHHAPDANDGVSADEIQLAQLIEAYRAANNLPAVPLSASLSLVAERHAEDIIYNQGGYQVGEPGSNAAHGWSDAPYDARNPATLSSMWTAPQRFGTSYPGAGYEILTGYLPPHTQDMTMTPQQALSGWQSSPPHNAVILSQGIWASADLTWNAMGVAILDGVAAVWFGHETDPAGLPPTDGATPPNVTPAPPKVTTTNTINIPPPTNGSGNDASPIGNGQDTVVTSAAFRQASVSTDAGGGSVTLTGPDGTKALGQVKAIHFLDGTYQLGASSTAAQVVRLYNAALGRGPDGAGLSFWVGQLQAGATLPQLAQSFLNSPEYQSRYGSGDSAAFVNAIYQNVLGRAPDAGGAAYWTGRLASGATRPDVLAAISESAENQSRTAAAVTPGVFVPDEQADSAARLYYTVFGRPPDAGGLAYWAGRLESGQAALQDEAAAFVQSPEFQAQYGNVSDQQFVDLLYRNVLGRAPDNGGEAFWTGQLASGAASRGSVVIGFSESAEHKAALAPVIENGGVVLSG